MALCDVFFKKKVRFYVAHIVNYAFSMRFFWNFSKNCWKKAIQDRIFCDFCDTEKIIINSMRSNHYLAAISK
jgi:hypothetical protein